MKKILLSMQPFWKEKIMSGEKIYEYRTRFLDEEVIAFLYVSTPVCGIAGVLHLGKKILLEDWKKEYSESADIVERVVEYEKRNNKVAMPVISYQETELITRKKLDQMLEKFVVPQSYYYLKEDMELTRYLEQNIRYIGEKGQNDFSCLNYDDICKEYRY